jgi:isopentenyldiphosphate isomerase
VRWRACACCYICVLILLYMYPHTTILVQKRAECALAWPHKRTHIYQHALTILVQKRAECALAWPHKRTHIYQHALTILVQKRAECALAWPHAAGCLCSSRWLAAGISYTSSLRPHTLVA